MKRDNREKVYKGASSQTIVTIILGILGILYFSVMSRLLSKEDFGYFAIISAVSSILASLSEAGFGAAVIQNKNSDNSFIQTAWTLSLIIGTCFCLSLMCSANLLSSILTDSDILTRGYQIISLTLIFYAINGVGRAVIIKKLQFLKYGVFDIVAFAISALVGIFMAYNEYGFYSVVVAILLHQVFLGVLIILSNRKIIAIKIEKDYVKQIISFGGWLTGSVVVRNITDQLDKLITRNWIPVIDLGAYNRNAGFISQITNQTFGIFDTILFPILSGISEDCDKIKTAYQKSVSLISLFSIFFASVIILGSDVIISIFLGEKWLYLSNVFQIISISIVFLGYNRLADCYFRSLGIVYQYFIIRCCILLTTCITMLVGCQFGIVGLALGLVFSRLINIVLKIYYLSIRISFNRKLFYKNLLHSWFLPIFIFIICYALKITMPYGGVLSVSLFVTAISLLLLVKPQIFGDIFYENVYVVVTRIIRNKINGCSMR